MYKSQSLSYSDQNAIRELIEFQRQKLNQTQKQLEETEQRTKEVKTITQDLLSKLNNEYRKGKLFDDDQQSQHSSDTSSMADEREIHTKLERILHILDEYVT